MKAPQLNRWKTVVAILVCIMIVPGCSTFNRQSNAPPNPIGQSSQPGGSAPAAPPSSSSAPRPVYYDFTDIPIPNELELVGSDSYVFQYGTFKAGLLTLKGRVDLNSVINFFQMAMPRENWKPKGGFRYRRSVLIFDKPDKTCIINLYEKTFYSYVEIYVAPATGQI